MRLGLWLAFVVTFVILEAVGGGRNHTQSPFVLIAFAVVVTALFGVRSAVRLGEVQGFPRRPARGQMRLLGASMALLMVAAAGSMIGAALNSAEAASPSGAIFTTTPAGTIVNENVHYDDKRDVYLDGGPPPNAPATAAGLDDGLYLFQVTDPSGKFLLSEDPSKCRIVRVLGGVIVERVSPSDLDSSLTDDYVNGKGNNGQTRPCHIDDDPPHPTNPGVRGNSGRHDTNADADHFSDAGAIVVQLMPYGTTPNPGGVYKAWITPLSSYQGKGGQLGEVPSKLSNGQQKPHKCPDFCASSDSGFGPPRGDVKTDNFKVRVPGPPPPPPPTLTVRKFHDRNGDGVWQAPTEPEITGWLIDITDPNGVTNTEGTPVEIIAEPLGLYVIDEENPSGWVHTATYLNGAFQGVVDSLEVTVTAGSNNEVIFGNHQPSEITACKFYDQDRNGTQGGELEVGLADWPMTLEGTSLTGLPLEETVGPVTQLTGSDGCTTFSGLVEGDYTVTEETPNEPEWQHTTDVTVSVELSPGESETVIFGNVCVGPFEGGLTMGYWKTHTGLHSPDRDSTYDSLPILLGQDGHGAPQELVSTEEQAFAVFDAAESSTEDGVLMLKAQLLAAKLNVLKFPGFDLADLPDGTVVGDAIADADQILHDLAHGISHAKAEIIAVKDLLDAANNNSNTQILTGPRPTPCRYTFR